MIVTEQEYVERPLRWLKEAKRWVLCRVSPRHMAHVVFTDLEPSTWYDADHVMLHACFKLLTDFVEKEHGGEARLSQFTDELAEESKTNTNESQLLIAQSDRQAEILKLYRWWKRERPVNWKREDVLMNLAYGNRINAKEDVAAWRAELKLVEEKNREDDQAMLHRLIDVRESLWT